MNTREDALREAARINGAKYHHTATARGYVCKECSYSEEYSGRYGNGYIIHVESRHSNRGNRHHVIEYWIL